MSLLKPVQLLVPDQVAPLHFLAIGGAGMSGIAAAYQQLGLPISGCDQVDSATLRQLAASGISTAVGHDPSHLDGVQTLVVSSAIRQDLPELVAAQQRGIRVWHRSAALAALMLERVGISIAGSHGKTTTSAMTAVLLDAAGADPSYVIGAPLASNRRSAHLGGGELFVVEADESDGSFLQYPTRYAVITNIEADHLDNWTDAHHYAAGFGQFATAPSVQHVVICYDDPGARRLADELRAAGRPVTTYGVADDADVRLNDVDFEGASPGATLTVPDELADAASGEQSWRLKLQVPGLHNLQNAAAAFALGRLLGLDAEALLAGAQAFTGTLRRFQAVGQPAVPGGQISVFDDYAHHPTELRAALSAARTVSPEGRLVACFQPHLFTRTRDFATEFGQALSLADVVVVTDVYPSREDPIPGVTGELVADAARAAGAQHVHYVADKADLPAQLASLVRPADLLLTLGAGDVTLVGPLLVGILEEQAGRADPAEAAGSANR